MKRIKKCLSAAFVFSLIVIFALMITGCTQEAENPQVAASTGTYTGNYADGIEEYLGIRYAAPIERWKKAQDVTTVTEDAIDATKWGPCCTQPYDEVEIASQGELSEDCLNLNIWTKDSKTADKPVFVFIHGGGFMNGGSNDPMYEGDSMVKSLGDDEDMVYVSINYRTNLFGSIDLSELEGYTDEYYDAVNLWILDQIQALKWINENISSWGGDPANVTVCGQSCGGMAISYMLAMPEATQYFQKAIIESGAPFIAQQTEAEKLKVADMIYDELDVNTLDEFLALSDEEIKENGLSRIFENLSGLSNIYADGKIIPKTWWDDIREGSAEGIRIMIGCTNGENDWAAYDYENGGVLKDSEGVKWYITNDSRNRGDKDAKYFINPISADGTANFDLDAYLATKADEVEAMTDLYNDMCYVQGTEYEAEALSEYTEVYKFYWTYAQDPDSVIQYCEDNGLEAEVSPYGRAQHSYACVFALGNSADGYNELTGDPAKDPETLQAMAMSAWYSFAKSGDPNNDLIPEWKTYDAEDRNTMVMDAEWSLEKDPRKLQREALTCRPQGEKQK